MTIRRIFHRIFRLTPLAILGPGLIATAAGNDAGGIATYSVAGATFGYAILWIMLPLTISFIAVQELSARLGAATGKGFSDLVRENFDLRSAVFMMVLLFAGNAGLVVSEFAGIAASLEMFGVSKYISIPLAAGILWWLIVKGNYEKVEKIFLAMSAVLISYLITMVVAKPQWATVGMFLIKPHITADLGYITLLVALIGTTIAPFMQVYAQSAVVEKGITMNDFGHERIDTFIGTIFANLVAVAIMVVTATVLYPHGIHIEDAATAATALIPFAGEFAYVLFAVGLLGASLLAAGVVPITTAFALSNAFGWESGVNHQFKDAPLFYLIFTSLILFGALITLSPAVSLIKLLVGLQVVNGILLPIQLYFMYRLANNANIMGKHRNGRLANTILLITIVAVGTAVAAFLLLSLKDLLAVDVFKIALL